MYAVTNPATGEVVKDYGVATDGEIAEALERAQQGHERLRATPLAERAAKLRLVADLYDERADALAARITEEMGKPIAQAKGEVQLVASIYRYYADNAATLLADEELDVAAGGRALVRKEPVGVLLAIMPWNFPYYQVARVVGPAMVVGNSVLLKHSPQNPASALEMEQIMVDAGFDAGEYVNVFASNDQVSNQIIPDPRVQGVTLTGSERAGAAVAEAAGRNLKKVVLELGGSDPFIVLDTADLPAVIKRASVGRMRNSGQACNSPKRFIVMDDLYDDFVAGMQESLSAMTMSDPRQPSTQMGPMSSVTAADNLARQVDRAVEQGATLRVGGAREEGRGAWYPPTLLTDITPEMDAYTEELFGPVAMVYRVTSEEEAIELANATPFGLGASINTEDPERALRVADQIDSGMVYINENSGTAAELPFGGVKRSGMGRELGKYGIEEFVNKKLIRIR
ncbi:MAG: NAD-dependent succinate-semialdehyde dehydrogenase [Actinomycetales bacterium]